MPSFQRRTGAQQNLSELCYVSALHQTQDGDVRRDGSIRAADVALYLRSRYAVVVSAEEVRRFMLKGLAGVGEGDDENKQEEAEVGNKEERDGKKEENAAPFADEDSFRDNDGQAAAESATEAAAATAAAADGTNDDADLDLAELTALLLVPNLRALAAELTDDDHDKGSISASSARGRRQNSAESLDHDLANGRLFEQSLRIILGDLGLIDGKTCDPSNGIYPELTEELLRSILVAYGEGDIAKDEEVVRGMMRAAGAQPAEGGSGGGAGGAFDSNVDSSAKGDEEERKKDDDEKEGMETSASSLIQRLLPGVDSRAKTEECEEGEEEKEDDDDGKDTEAPMTPKICLDPATFARALTADLHLLDPSDEYSLTTNYQDVMRATDTDAKGAKITGSYEDIELGRVSTSLDKVHKVPVPVFDFQRLRFSTAHIDFCAGRYASKYIVTFLFASFILYIFGEMVLSGKSGTGYVYYTFFVQTDPCRFIAFHDEAGTPDWLIANKTFPDGTQTTDWVDYCQFYKEPLGKKIGVSIAIWLYRFVTFLVVGYLFIGLGGLGNDFEPHRCCNRRVAAMFGFFFIGSAAVGDFMTRIAAGINIGAQEKNVDTAAFRFISYSYFILALVVMLLQLLIAFGLGDKIKQITSSSLYSERAMKQAAAHKTNNMMKNALKLHANGIGSNRNKSGNSNSMQVSSLGVGLLRFAVEEENTETVGGFLWIWKRFLNGELFYREGIHLSGRVLAVNIVQGLVACYIIIWGVSLTNYTVELWKIGKDRIDNLFDLILGVVGLSLSNFNFERVADKIDISGFCSSLDDPSVCDKIPIDTFLKDYVSRDLIQGWLADLAYRVYPAEEYIVRTPLTLFTAISGGIALILFFLYIPSVYGTILRFRCGENAFFDNQDRFKIYRRAVDKTTFMLGTVFWTGYIGPMVLGSLVAIPVFIGLWAVSVLPPGSGAIVATAVGLIVSVIIKEVLSILMMRNSFHGFYRDNVNKVNICAVGLEAVTIGLGVFYAFVRIIKIVVTSLLYISRIDTPLLSMDLAIGPLQDMYPIFFRQGLLVEESHKHPWISVLGKMYLMKWRYREAFASPAGYVYRLIFSMSLMPYLRKYRVHNREMDRDEGDNILALLTEKANNTVAGAANKMISSKKKFSKSDGRTDESKTFGVLANDNSNEE